MELKIHMGCLADPIKDQVKAQGLLITDQKADELQSYVEAVNLLYMNDILNEKEMHSAESKIFTQIKKSVRIPKEK